MLNEKKKETLDLYLVGLAIPIGAFLFIALNELVKACCGKREKRAVGALATTMNGIHSVACALLVDLPRATHIPAKVMDERRALVQEMFEFKNNANRISRDLFTGASRLAITDSELRNSARDAFIDQRAACLTIPCMLRCLPEKLSRMLPLGERKENIIALHNSIYEILMAVQGVQQVLIAANMGSATSPTSAVDDASSVALSESETATRELRAAMVPIYQHVGAAHAHLSNCLEKSAVRRTARCKHLRQWLGHALRCFAMTQRMLESTFPGIQTEPLPTAHSSALRIPIAPETPAAKKCHHCSLFRCCCGGRRRVIPDTLAPLQQPLMQSGVGTSAGAAAGGK